MCVTCLCPFTLSHVIIECTGFSVVHNKHFGASSVGSYLKMLMYGTSSISLKKLSLWLLIILLFHSYSRFLVNTFLVYLFLLNISVSRTTWVVCSKR